MAEVFSVWRCSDVLGELVVQKQREFEGSGEGLREQSLMANRKLPARRAGLWLVSSRGMCQFSE